MGKNYLPFNTGRYALVRGSIESLPKNVRREYLTSKIRCNVRIRAHWPTFDDGEITALETRRSTAGRFFHDYSIRTLEFNIEQERKYALLHHRLD